MLEIVLFSMGQLAVIWIYDNVRAKPAPLKEKQS